MEEYSHPDHGKMEWVEYETRHKDIAGWKCERCNVIAPPDRVDPVFDEHDCENYQNVGASISTNIG